MTKAQNIVHNHLRLCRILALCLFVAAVILGVLWFRNPQGNYEPLILVLTSLAALIGVPSLVDSFRPVKKEELPAPALEGSNSQPQNGNARLPSFKTRDSFVIVIECVKQLNPAERSPEALCRRLDTIYDEHAELFPEEAQGFFVRVDLNSDIIGIVSLNRAPQLPESELRLHSLYRFPEDEAGRAWERLSRGHLEILNSEWRNNASFRKREASFKHFRRQLASHLSNIERFVAENAPEAQSRLDRARENYFEFLELRLGTERDTPQIVEGLVQAIHVILEDVQPHSIALH